MTSDYEAICQLVHRYGHLVDARRIGDLADLFLEDGVHDLSQLDGPKLMGRQAIRDYGTQPTLANRPSMHLFANPVIETDGDRATGTWACLVYARPDGLNIISGNQYQDEYVRTEEGWRFRSRTQRFLVPPNLDQDAWSALTAKLSPS
jgi:hypothetical protein